MKEEQKSEECECCEYKTSELRFYKGGFGLESQWLCNVCASTFISLINKDQSADYNLRLLARSVAHIANMLLSEIRKK
jgi:hypothetical protein